MPFMLVRTGATLAGKQLPAGTEQVLLMSSLLDVTFFDRTM